MFKRKRDRHNGIKKGKKSRLSLISQAEYLASNALDTGLDMLQDSLKKVKHKLMTRVTKKKEKM